jgi:hypothetical protein
MSGVVNPDILLAAIWAAFAYVSVRLVLLGPSLRRLAAIALLVVASFLTHGRGIALLAPAAVAILLMLWRHRARYPRAVRIAPVVAVVLGVIAAVVLQRRGAYGGEVTLGPHFSISGFLSYLWQFYLPGLPFMTAAPGPHYGFHEMVISEFVGGRFGSLEVGFAPVVYAALQLVVVLMIAGVVAGVIAYRQQLARVWDVALLLATIAVCELLLLHLVSYRSLSGNTGDPIIVGRYLLPLAAIYGVTGAFVAVTAGRRAGPLIASALIAISLALQLGGLTLTIGRFYG